MNKVKKALQEFISKVDNVENFVKIQEEISNKYKLDSDQVDEMLTLYDEYYKNKHK